MTLYIDDDLESIAKHNLDKGDWDTPAPAPWIQSLATDDTETIFEKGEEFTQKTLDK